jgi:tetratricopeptide (TPR) repeat protein
MVRWNNKELPPHVEAVAFKGDYKKLLELLPQYPEDALLIHELVMFECFPGVNHPQCIESASYLIEHSKDGETLAKAYHLKGCLLDEYKQQVEAIDCLKKALELEPDADSTIYTLADIYEKRGDYDEALKYFHMAEQVFIESENEQPDLYADIAELYFLKKKDYENARKYFEKVAKLEAEYTEGKQSTVGLCGLGRVAGSTNENDKALEYLEKARAIDPDNAYTLYYMGQAWQNKDEYYLAMHYYTEALKMKPDFAEVYNNIAAFYYHNEGDITAAIDNLLKAVELRKDGPLLTTVYLNLARLYGSVADYDKQNFYKAKMLESLGFGVEWREEDDDDDEGDVLK